METYLHQNYVSNVILGVREGILLGGTEKICPENNNLPWK